MSDLQDYKSPKVTTDIALFTYADQKVKVLLIQRGHPPFQGQWAFPGGFLDYGEEPKAGALRELQEETGISSVAIEQFGAFGDPDRDPRGHTVSIAYLGVIDISQSSAKGGDDAADAQWFDVTELPQLAFDHSLIFSTAIEKLDQKLSSAKYHDFFPDNFTLSDLKYIYKIILKVITDASADRK